LFLKLLTNLVNR